MHIDDVMDMTAEFTGVAASSIYRAKKEFRECDGKFSTPGKVKPNAKGKRTRIQIYDEFTLSAIRKKVHTFFRANDPPTVKKVCDAVNEDLTLPNFTYRTLLRVMHDLGFVYKTRSRNSMLIERDDIVLWRRRYLREIRRLVAEKKPVYYLDETWLNAGHTKSRVWQDTTVKCKRDAFLNGLTTGLKQPTGKGGRLIVVHAGNEDGFVNNAGLVFRAKKGTGDYHEEMDGPRFEKWFKEQLLPNIKPNSTIVIDNAPYHTVKTEKIPNTSTRKPAIQAWLTSK